MLDSFGIASHLASITVLILAVLGIFFVLADKKFVARIIAGIVLILSVGSIFTIAVYGFVNWPTPPPSIWVWTALLLAVMMSSLIYYTSIPED